MDAIRTALAEYLAEPGARERVLALVDELSGTDQPPARALVERDPQRVLHDRVEGMVAREGIPYRDALRAVVAAEPALWQRARATQPNGVQ